MCVGGGGWHYAGLCCCVQLTASIRLPPLTPALSHEPSPSAGGGPRRPLTPSCPPSPPAWPILTSPTPPSGVAPTEPPDCPCFTASCRVRMEEGRVARGHGVGLSAVGASQPLARAPSVGPNVFWLCQQSPRMTCPVGLLRGSAVPETGLLPCAVDQGHPEAHSQSMGEGGGSPGQRSSTSVNKRPHLRTSGTLCSRHKPAGPGLPPEGGRAGPWPGLPRWASRGLDYRPPHVRGLGPGGPSLGGGGGCPPLLPGTRPPSASAQELSPAGPVV